MLLFVVTPCFLVAVQPCMERIPITNNMIRTRNSQDMISQVNVHVMDIVRILCVMCVGQYSMYGFVKKQNGLKTHISNLISMGFSIV